MTDEPDRAWDRGLPAGVRRSSMRWVGVFPWISRSWLGEREAISWHRPGDPHRW